MIVASVFLLAASWVLLFISVWMMRDVLRDERAFRAQPNQPSGPWNWNTTTRDPVGWANAHQPLDRKDQK